MPIEEKNRRLLAEYQKCWPKIYKQTLENNLKIQSLTIEINMKCEEAKYWKNRWEDCFLELLKLKLRRNKKNEEKNEKNTPV